MPSTRLALSPLPAYARLMSTRVANGPAIKAIREALGMSQAQLGHRCDVSGSHIGRVEAGEKQGSSKLLIHIAATLGVPVFAITQNAGTTNDD